MADGREDDRDSRPAAGAGDRVDRSGQGTQLEIPMTQKRRELKSLVFGVLLVAVGCSSAPPGPDPAVVAKSVNDVADEYLHGYLDAFPEAALSMGARDPHPDQLGDHSLPALKRWEQREDELLGKLKKISIAPIDDRPEALTYKFLQQLLEASIGFRALPQRVVEREPDMDGLAGVASGDGRAWSRRIGRPCSRTRSRDGRSCRSTWMTRSKT